MKPATCPSCKRHFKSQAGLVAHLRHNHKDGAVATYESKDGSALLLIRRVKAVAQEFGGLKQLRELIDELV